jgi:hypothetical protein
VLDATERRVTLERLEARESRGKIGVETAPRGNSDREFERMCKLPEGWRDKIRASHLQKADAWQVLNTTIWKSLEYSLPVTSLSEAKCDAIMAPAIMAGLASSHICRNFPRALIYAPAANLGAGIPNIFTVQ